MRLHRVATRALVVSAAWDAPTPENGFRPVVRNPGKCPPQGYPMTTATGYDPDETSGEAR